MQEFRMYTFITSIFRHRVLPTVAEAERDYLNAAVSRFDLERRQMDVERGLFRQAA